MMSAVWGFLKSKLLGVALAALKKGSNKMVLQPLIALTKLLKCLLGGNASETTSARAYRRTMDGSKRWAVARKWINRLFFWQEDHCKSAYHHDRQMAIDYLSLKLGPGNARDTV